MTDDLLHGDAAYIPGTTQDRTQDKWNEYSKLVFELAIRGLDTPAMLDGADVDDFSFTHKDAIGKAVVVSAIRAAEVICKVKNRQRCEVMVAVEQCHGIEANAKEAVDQWMDPKN